ncbi:MAG: helix-turn-helix transcriptional regulator [Thermoanaerobaculia bacterium]|nr:helix-turn-helix transcriptional regulator [Thermoanaerobaculia bacterium]
MHISKNVRTPEEVSHNLAARLRRLRLDRGWKQTTLAQRSGVSLGSLRRFESSGAISLANLLKLAFALRRLDDFGDLLRPPPARTTEELIAQEHDGTQPQRGRI